ncbi:alkaline phosphatase family protein [Ornithobacterium rhinotracheale]|nr:alkaline phosphatase family protein [Ornithobacterium rhinotracheale]
MRWKNFIKELSNLIFFWFVGIVFFSVFRLLFILIYREKIQTFEWLDLSRVLFMGFRFDTTVMGYFTVLPLFMLLVFSLFTSHLKIITKTRKIIQILFSIFSVLICDITLNYFKEYHQQFNNFVFLAIYDDRKAAFNSIIKDFHPILNSVIIILGILFLFIIFRKFEKSNFIYSILSKIESKLGKSALVLLIIILFIGGIRGSFTGFPARKFTSAVSKDAFLNKTIINPYRSLIYAYEEFNELNNFTENPFITEKTFHQTFKNKYVTDLLMRKAQGASIQKPKQIFLVIMESYDSWPLMDKYRPLKLSEKLSAIADKSLRFTHFLPASYGTFNSLGSIVTNIPYVGINISHIRESKKPFETSIFEQFKKLGYKTNLFYGGFLSWENIGDFSLNQGADHVYSAMDYADKTDLNVWGVEDEDLFKLVNQSINPEEYTFNLILTTSYHTPYTVDVDKKGFPYKKKEDFPKDLQKYYDNGLTLKEMGHLWYGDKCIGDFVEQAEQKFPNAIFGFTGDHFGRRFITHQPNLYERSSVNFILYGKSITPELKTTPGTHIDIMPTIIEMIAPKDFIYYSFGESLLNSDKKQAISFEKIIQNNDLYYFPAEEKKEKINLRNWQEDKVDLKNTPIDAYSKQMSLAWYYTVKGNDLNKK